MGGTTSPKCMVLEFQNNSLKICYLPAILRLVFGDRRNTNTIKHQGLMSFLFTPAAPDNLTKALTAPWLARKLLRFDQIVNPTLRSLYPFEVLRKCFSLPKNLSYGYLQIRHLTTMVTKYQTFDHLTPFESL